MKSRPDPKTAARKALGKRVRAWLTMSVRQWLNDFAKESGETILVADGFDDALVGYATRCGQPSIAVYDREKCITILMTRDGHDRATAEEFYEFNVAGSWVGKGTPCFLVRPEVPASLAKEIRHACRSVP
jgi:hypothetical protein